MTNEENTIPAEVLEEQEEATVEAPAIPLGPETEAIIIRGIN